MNNRKVRQIVFPLLAAMIWGSGFVVQSLCATQIGTFTFNTLRSWVAVLALLLICLLKNRGTKKQKRSKKEKRDLIYGGFWCGLFLALGVNLQQFGMTLGTNAGKTGFITALYIVLVPAFSLLFGKKVKKTFWVCVCVAMIGFYYLSIHPGSGNGLQPGDFLVFCCAITSAAQFMAIDRYAQSTDGLELSCVQFVFTGLISTIGMIIFEPFSIATIITCIPYILYMGVFSSGVAFSLQILAQKDGNPTVVSLLCSMESFFAAVFGAILLHEQLSMRETIGCALILFAVILSQLIGANKETAD